MCARTHAVFDGLWQDLINLITALVENGGLQWMQILVGVDSSRRGFQQTWILVDVDSSRRRFWQTWILVDVDSSRRRFQQAWIIVDVDSSRRGFQQTWILVDVGVHPSSVSLRRSCCNWACPVTLRQLVYNYYNVYIAFTYREINNKVN